ncbi:MAG TPA: hypothetical protein VNO30_45350 [Kofleriaceae bacterium]|nr:hypothetical protein [Kofleriaceae bacterium]
MRKLFGLSLLAAGLAAAISCSVPAHADQPTGPQLPAGSQIAIGIAPAKVRAPYDVQVIREGGDTLPTYAHKDRFYVQGNAGERYVIRVTNPTPNRVEAIVSVDGLDVIDGEPGDLRKRGYVVPPYGDVRIEGFRTSHQDVATFRFSSVNDSYAGQKGKARNVGVIAVAIFEEQRETPQQIIVEPKPEPTTPGYRKPYDYTDDLDSRAEASRSRGAGMKAKDAEAADKSVARADRAAPKKAAAAPAPAAEAPATGRSAYRRPAPAPAPAPTGGAGGAVGSTAPSADYDGSFEGEAAPPPPAERTNRPGLGTEFGEQRHSSASFTRFVRAGGRPVAIAELRYNDADGLAALGIRTQPLPDPAEVMTRETADPFPGDDRFARPPGR